MHLTLDLKVLRFHGTTHSTWGVVWKRGESESATDVKSILCPDLGGASSDLDHGSRAGSSRSSTVRFRLYCFLQHSAMILLRQTRCAIGRRRHIAHFHVSPAWWATRKVLQRFKLADIGEGITECEVIKWYVSQRYSLSSRCPLSSHVVYRVLYWCARRNAKHGQACF